MNAARLEAVVAMFEGMRRADIARLAEWYTEAASFKDPFNDVTGVAAIQRIYLHMFDTLQAPRFRITSRVLDGDQCMLAWEFHLDLRGQPATIRGATHLVFAPDGRIAVHRDYWDAAEELYEKVPVLGGLMRWIKRRLRA